MLVVLIVAEGLLSLAQQVLLVATKGAIKIAAALLSVCVFYVPVCHHRPVMLYSLGIAHHVINDEPNSSVMLLPSR